MGKNRKFNNGSSPWDYVGNMASMAGTGMAIGGPIGAGIGAFAGLGMSMMNSEKANAAEAAIARNEYASNMMRKSSMVKANYDMNNTNNTGIPGFKNGASRFMPQVNGMPNAYVSKGEVIRNPVTGSLDKVPGEYNGSNPDTVQTNLMNGSSVFSASSKNKLPFGKSTPADIANRMLKAKSTAEEKLSGKGSRLDKSTAELNVKNITRQLGNLDKLTYLQNFDSRNTGMPMFNNGKPGIDGKPSIMDGISSFIPALASLAPALSNIGEEPEVTPPIFDDYINPMASYNIAPEMRSIASESRVARYNQGELGGAGMAYGANIYGRSLQAKSALTDRANRFNAEQLNSYANRYNQNSASSAAERRRIQDVNMRNKAASRSIQNAGMSQFSNFVQNRELMANQKDGDIINASIWAMASKDIDADTKKALTELLSKKLNYKIG